MTISVSPCIQTIGFGLKGKDRNPLRVMFDAHTENAYAVTNDQLPTKCSSAVGTERR
jgi:hypothetical protein